MTEHIRHIEFTNLKCDYSGISIPYGWIVVVVEPVIPRFINGQVDLELPWLDAAGAPCLAPAIFSANSEEEVEGLDELNDHEIEWMDDASYVPFDCWQEIAEALDNLTPDERPSDDPLSCDFCGQSLAFEEPAMRIRSCTTKKPKRCPNGSNGVTLEQNGYCSDFVMCLSCAYVATKEVLPNRDDGSPFWPL